MELSELFDGAVVLSSTGALAIVVSYSNRDNVAKNVLLKLYNGSLVSDHWSKLQPQPLNAAFFIKAGFTSGPYGGAWRTPIDGSVEYFYCWHERVLRFQTRGAGHTRRMEHIKYIHQLQHFHQIYTNKPLPYSPF